MHWCTSHVGLRLTASTGQGPEVVKQNGFFWHLATRNGPCVGSSEVRIIYTWYCMYIIYMSLKHCWYDTIKFVQPLQHHIYIYMYTNIPQHPSMGGHRLRLLFVFFLAGTLRNLRGSVFRRNRWARSGRTVRRKLPVTWWSAHWAAVFSFTEERRL